MVEVGSDRITQIPGWFEEPDIDLFRLLLHEGRQVVAVGDVAEIGAYLGKSAVLVGAYLDEGERFTVVDLFESPAPDAANQQEYDTSYGDLTRERFEANYLSIHDDLPLVVQSVSTEVLRHARHGHHRFVHVDASHLYEHVRSDLQSARTLLRPNGIVAIDDYREEHTPGVAAAAWHAVAEGLRPVALTYSKMYATWGEVGPWQRVIEAWLPQTALEHEYQQIGADRVLLLSHPWPEEDEHLGWSQRWLPPVLAPRVTAIHSRLRRRS